MWGADSAAFNWIDESYDIDPSIVIADNGSEGRFLPIEEIIQSLAPIKFKYILPTTTWHEDTQAFLC